MLCYHCIALMSHSFWKFSMNCTCAMNEKCYWLCTFLSIIIVNNKKIERANQMAIILIKSTFLINVTDLHSYFSLNTKRLHQMIKSRKTISVFDPGIISHCTVCVLKLNYNESKTFMKSYSDSSKFSKIIKSKIFNLQQKLWKNLVKLKQEEYKFK